MSLRKASCLALGLFLAASAVHAAAYTVTLSNGTSFETRYRPMTAEWDTNYAMLRTDQGNWIALKKSEIVDVTSAAEMSGFGYQINDTTIFLGWSASEGLVGEDGATGDGAGGAAPGAPGAAPAAPAAGAAGESTTPSPGYTMQQFVSVPTTGVVPGGIPLGGTTSGGVRPNS